MRHHDRIGILAILMIAACLPVVGAEDNLRATLWPGNIADVRITLNAAGGQLGFEAEIPGDDPRLEALVSLIREGETGGGHRCANTGAIRLRMKDGHVVGVGLLPSHAGGSFGLRLYDDRLLVGVYRVDREALLAALEDLGVPGDDPAFRQ